MSNEIPDIQVDFDDSYNPMIVSPNSPYGLQFYQTQESMADVEVYKKFLNNAISRFRHSKFYKQYKEYIFNDIGLNHCQVMHNISKDDATLEMHHNFLTIFDIALIITEHILKTKGYISTFDLVQLLKEEHRQNHIPIVMLSKTPHQLYHNNDELIFPAQMCFGDWAAFLSTYNQGLATKRIVTNIMNFINLSVSENNLDDKNLIYTLLEVRDNVKKWSDYNEYGDNIRISGVTYTNTTNNWNY